MFKYIEYGLVVLVQLAALFVAFHYGRYLERTTVPQYYATEHPLCKGSDREEAWVAYKNGQLRCFKESLNYPHRGPIS